MQYLSHKENKAYWLNSKDLFFAYQRFIETKQAIRKRFMLYVYIRGAFNLIVYLK